MIPQLFVESIDLGDGRNITIETGRLAKQADGSVVVRIGKTVILGTVVSARKASPGIDFLPFVLLLLPRRVSSLCFVVFVAPRRRCITSDHIPLACRNPRRRRCRRCRR